MNRIKHRRLRWVVPLLVPVLLAVAQFDVAAQAPVQMVRTLVIKDNQVLIDGREVAQDNLPPGMKFDGITVSYSFVGIEYPVVTIGEQFFAVLENRLQPIESREQHRAVFRQEKPRELDARRARGWIVDSDRGEYYNFQGERLNTLEAVPRLLNEANVLYLEDLQTRNQGLFSRLSHERELESEAAHLAIAARQSRSKDNWEMHRKALTEKLKEIFELKQQNRRDEIAQFEVELEQLRRRVERRDELKQRIIDDRVNWLTETGR